MLLRPPFPRINRNAPLAKGLVFAALGGGASTLMMADASGYGNHGVLTSMDPTTDWVWDSTLNRWVLDFDGSNDYVTTGRDMFATVSAFTIAAWVKMDTSAFYEGIFGNKTTYDGSGVVVWFQDNQLCLRVQNAGISGSGGDGRYSVVCTAGVWTHGVWTYDGNTILAYQNGVPRYPLAIGAKTLANTTVSVGKSYVGYYDGQISDPLLHNRVLSPAEIQQLADPSNVMLSGLILPPVRRLWSVPSVGNRRRRFLVTCGA